MDGIKMTFTQHFPTTPTGVLRRENRTSHVSGNGPVKSNFTNIPTLTVPVQDNHFPPSSPQYCSFAVPPGGLRKGERRSTNIRVIARIRPLSDNELGASTITPLLNEGHLEESQNQNIMFTSPPRGRRQETNSSQPLQDVFSPTGSSVANIAARFDSPRKMVPGQNEIGKYNKQELKKNESHCSTPICKNTALKDIANTDKSTNPVGTPISKNTTKRMSHLQPASPPPSNRPPSSPAQMTSQSLSVGISTKKKFDYDAVFGPQIDQKEMYDRSIGDAVRRNIFRGYNTTIIAYGQTGSGKTYTMTGPSKSHNCRQSSQENIQSPPLHSPPRMKRKSTNDSTTLSFMSPSKSAKNSCVSGPNKSDGPHDMAETNEEQTHHEINLNDGIIPRAVNDLFVEKERHATGGDVCIRMTYIELYNDNIYDLLDENQTKTANKLTLHDRGDSGVLIKGKIGFSF